MEQDSVKEIIIPYSPRAWQLDLHNDPSRFRVIIAHRGSGKSFWGINELIRAACTGPPAAEYLYVLPQQNQARRNVWDHICRFVRPIPGVVIQNQSMTTRFPNGSKILLLGSDNPDNMRGLHVHGVVLDEVDDMHPDIWTVVRPTLTTHKGFCVWIGTPKGRQKLWEFYNRSQEVARTSWSGTMLPWDKTDVLSKEEVEAIRSEMSPEAFSQELECFPQGSLVSTGDDLCPIEDLKVGDLVFTHKGRLRPIKRTMQKHYVGDLIVIKAWGGKPLSLTPDHPVRVCDPSTQTYSWLKARDVRANDWLVTPNNILGRVHTIDTERYDGIVYNLAVEDDESYTVSNWAVHNCSFDAALVGAYFGRNLADLREHGRIAYFDPPLYRDDLEVITSWDFGIRDATAIWFWQMVKDDLHLIDYEEYSNWGFQEYAELLKNKGYRYGCHIAPHDVKVREMGTGVERLESARNVGIEFEQCPFQGVMDGIEIVRQNIHRCKIDMTTCSQGVNALSAYKAKIDKSGQPVGPEHDWASHCGDSFRYGMTYIVQTLNQPAMVRMPLMRR